MVEITIERVGDEVVLKKAILVKRSTWEVEEVARLKPEHLDMDRLDEIVRFFYGLLR